MSYGLGEYSVMKFLPNPATDEQIMALADEWAALVAAGDFDAAYALSAQSEHNNFTAQMIREVIEDYRASGEEDSDDVGRNGQPCREFTRWDLTREYCLGYIWYDLDVDGKLSYLTADFYVVLKPEGVVIELYEIHVK
jgi:hypothetical protein